MFTFLPSLRGRRTRAADEGLIAPRTPVRSSSFTAGSAPQQGYFPWNGGSGDASPRPGTPTGPAYGNLSVDPIRRSIGSTPPPPRRVQSEAQMTANNVNRRSSSPHIVPGALGISEEPAQLGPLDSSLAAVSTGLGVSPNRLGVSPRKVPSRPTSPLSGGNGDVFKSKDD